MFWVALIAVAVGGGLVIAELWSFAIGFAFAGTLVLAGYEGHKRWNRTQWLRQFPDLEATDVVWKPRSRGWRV